MCYCRSNFISVILILSYRNPMLSLLYVNNEFSALKRI
jgi:hypothetical protein